MQTPTSIKDLLVQSITLKMTETEKKVRDEVLQYIIAEHKPFPTKGYSHKIVLDILAEKNLLAYDENDNVVSIYPISAHQTNKKVIFSNNRWAYAMCAIDAIGCHYAFEEPIVIEGECQHCGHKLVISVENGRVHVKEGSADIYVIHTDLDNTNEWSCYCCNIMHFFTCKDSLYSWAVENGVSNKVIPVDLETANKIAWLLFSN